MPFVVNPIRKKTFKREIDGESFEVDFEFECHEDSDFEAVMNREGTQINTFYLRLRRSLKAVRGIVGPDGELDMKKEDEQKAVFEFLTTCPGLLIEIQDAYLGLNPKNSKSGVMQQ
jgi:hypothetical protein